MKNMTLFAALSACFSTALHSNPERIDKAALFPKSVFLGALCTPDEYDATYKLKPNACNCLRNLEAASDGINYLGRDALTKNSGISEKELEALGTAAKAYYYDGLHDVAGGSMPGKFIGDRELANPENIASCGSYKLARDEKHSAFEIEEVNELLATRKAVAVVNALLEHRRNTIAPQITAEFEDGRTFVIDQNGIQYEKVGENFYPAVYRQPK